MTLTPTHIRLLRSGARRQYIGLSDNMSIRTGEIAALGELHRMGFAEHAKGPFPPGPPSLTPSVITDAGLDALHEITITTTAAPIYCHGCQDEIVMPGRYSTVNGRKYHIGCEPPGFANTK